MNRQARKVLRTGALRSGVLKLMGGMDRDEEWASGRAVFTEQALRRQESKQSSPLHPTRYLRSIISNRCHKAHDFTKMGELYCRN